MAGPKITAPDAALKNLQDLAKLVSSGKNPLGTCVGILTAPDGRKRIVKFTPSKGMDNEMKTSCDQLREQIGKWKEALEGKKDDDSVLARKFAERALETNRDEQNLVGDENGESELAGLGADPKEPNLIGLQRALVNAIGNEPISFKDEGLKNAKPLSFKETKTALASDERFTYRAQTTSDRGAAIGAAVAKRSGFMNSLHAVGRKIMTATHAIKAFFHGRTTKAAGWSLTTADYAGLAGTGVAQMCKLKLPQLPDEKKDEAKYVPFDAHVVASSCGLSGKLDLRPFPKGESIYPKDGPSIMDIHQNPDLQDCWFLSSISAMLHSQGPGSITRLIDLTKVPGQAVVRLGKHRYQVPLADVLVDGKRAVSDSAPWVRLLEQAMSMHRSQLAKEADDQINEKNVRMSFADSTFGLNALAGVEVNMSSRGVLSSGVSTRMNVTRLDFEQVQQNFLLNNGGHAPLVLGSKSGFTGTLASLGTGISPGHACAVLDVDADKKRVTVLDPYGHVRHLAADDLKYFDLVGIPKKTIEKEKPVPNAKSGNAMVDALANDNDKNDF